VEIELMNNEDIENGVDVDSEERDMSFFFENLPGQLQELLLNDMKGIIPQRKTDIWYEDDERNIQIMRKNVKYTLNEECGEIWKNLNMHKQVSEIMELMQDKYKYESPEEINKFVVSFLLNAHFMDIVVLYPKEFSTENLSSIIDL
jgi:hypothetical protein